ncbi:MAG: PAS domain S-box protein [Deltaproteobacteria bacterium]|nr:PAS domain S-box protein [Deltaproteobacteria bacterium]
MRSSRAIKGVRLSTVTPIRRPRPYAVAVAASLTAEAFKIALGPIIIQSTFLTSFGSILFSVWYGGFGPGVVCTLVSMISATALYQPWIRISAERDLLFVVSGIAVSFLMDRLFVEQRRVVSQKQRELEEANATLRDSEERFHQAFESAVLGMALLNLDGFVVQVNESLCRVVGYDRSRLLGKTAASMVHPDDHTASEHDRGRLLAGEIRSYQAERRLLHKDGRIVWTLVSVSLLRDVEGRPRYLVSQVQDITGRKRAEDELRRSEERFRTLAETVAAAIFIYKGTALCYVNSEAEAITGYSRAELQRMSFWEVIHPDFRNMVSDRGSARLRGEDVESRYEVMIQRKDGSTRWVDFTGARFQFEDGPAVLGTAFDITERKLVQAAAREREAELAHMLRLTTMNEMAAGLAHEINQPLSAIVNYAKGCVRRLDAGTQADPVVRAAIDRIGEEALRAGEIIRRLRQLVRKEPPRRDMMDLNRLVGDALLFFEGDTHDLSVRVEVDLSAEPIRIFGDGVQIEQVILNLIRNGLDAIRDADNGRRQLFVSTRCDGAVATVEVRDTGGGLPEVGSERIFEPFFTTKSNGLGMGLSISRSIVETHGGRLQARPNEGGGACLSFTLPIAGEAQEYVH